MSNKQKKESIMTFFLDDDLYAIKTDSIEETIKSPDSITPIPNFNKNMLGIMNYRIDICPVLSLRNFFNLEKKDADRIVIINVPREDEIFKIGFLFDENYKVFDLCNSNKEVISVKNLPKGLQNEEEEYVERMIYLRDGESQKKVLQIDLVKILNSVCFENNRL